MNGIGSFGASWKAADVGEDVCGLGNVESSAHLTKHVVLREAEDESGRCWVVITKKVKGAEASDRHRRRNERQRVE